MTGFVGFRSLRETGMSASQVVPTHGLRSVGSSLEHLVRADQRIAASLPHGTTYAKSNTPRKVNSYKYSLCRAP
jgi:hypothetical protein